MASVQLFSANNKLITLIDHSEMGGQTLTLYVGSGDQSLHSLVLTVSQARALASALNNLAAEIGVARPPRQEEESP